MTKAWMLGCVAALALGACNNDKADPQPTSQKAADAAGNETLAAGLGDNKKFVAAIEAAGLKPALAGPTPYTLLAPSDAAFDKLGNASETLMKPESRKQLTAVLTSHILPGTMLETDLGKAIDAGGGKAQIRTLGGGTLTVTRSGDKLKFADAAGTSATVLAADQQRSNGIIHHIDAVLMPAAR